MPTSRNKISLKIRDEHFSIKSGIQAIRQHVKSNVSENNFKTWRDKLFELINKMAAELSEHFEQEEDGGFMSDILKNVPQKKHAISQLKAEHEMMTQDISVIQRCIKETKSLDETQIVNLSHQINEFLDLLTAHEAAENLLLEDIYLRNKGLSG